LIKRHAVVPGRVTLASGKEADYYFDLRRVTLHPVGAPLVGSNMLDHLERETGWTAGGEYQAVGGLTMGADPVALAMLHQAHAQNRLLDAFVVRKEAKTHGLQRRIEGPDVAGRPVIVVEDTSTTGGSVLTAVDALEAGGAQVMAVAVVLDRNTGARERIEERGLPYFYLFDLDDLGDLT
jgi:orotate phosphoribosyltransferase